MVKVKILDEVFYVSDEEAKELAEIFGVEIKEEN